MSRWLCCNGRQEDCVRKWLQGALGYAHMRARKHTHLQTRPCELCLLYSLHAHANTKLLQGFPGWIIQTIRFVILINGTIPISLYITLEMIKVLQCSLMLNQDRKVRSCGQCMLVIWDERKGLNGQALQCSLMLNQDRKEGVIMWSVRARDLG